jgi:ATP-dependent helicase HrpA
MPTSSSACRRARAPDADRQRSGAPGRHHPDRIRRGARKIKDTKGAPEATQDAAAAAAPGAQELPRRHALAAAAALCALPEGHHLRLDKLRADPARDAAKLAELRPQEQRYWRLVAERKGQVDARMQELRWLLEELRVSFFAQELRTPQPVSVKRLDKVWAQRGRSCQSWTR